MPRMGRLVIPGYLYHVTQRGNFRENVFESDIDRATYLRYIQESRETIEISIYAYCLMDNHVHFIVKPLTENSLAKLFSVAHMKYAHYFNIKRKRVGHLWQGRFYSCLLAGDHIIEAIRYVECNPVRAGMVKYAWDYTWSSARAHLGTEYKIIRLANIKEYINVPSWRNYLTEEEDKKQLHKLRESSRKGLIFGSTEFIQRMEEKLNIKMTPRPRGRPKIGTDTIFRK
jgi:putative transposase